MVTRQYFKYKNKGVDKVYLLMPSEYSALKQIMINMGYSAHKAFEYHAGQRENVTEVSLVLEFISA